jgi:hypothetical protein
LGSDLRKEGSLGYDGGLVRLRVQTNFDTTFNRQQAPFSGAVAREKVIKIRCGIAFVIIFRIYIDFSFASLNFYHPQNKKNQSRVLLNPSFLLSFVYIFLLLTITEDGRLHLQQKNV